MVERRTKKLISLLLIAFGGVAAAICAVQYAGIRSLAKQLTASGIAPAEAELLVHHFRATCYWTWTIAALAVIGASIILASYIAAPLKRLRAAIGHFRDGDLSYRVEGAGYAESEKLADELFEMARTVENRIAELGRARGESEAIIASIREGLLAIDDSDRIIAANRAAMEMLGITAPKPQGLLLQEAVRNAELLRYIEFARQGDGAAAPAEKLIQGPQDKKLQLSSTALMDGAGKRRGTVLVLSDVTRLHRLETVRKEFVSNVSHELRTPLASIKGFIETLMDGALDDQEKAARFVNIIDRQANRLGEIIEDLLTLSRIESQEGEGAMEKTPCRLRGLLDAAANDQSRRLAEKNISVAIECDETLKVAAASNLLAQAIGNLLANAVEYSPAGSPVQLTARPESGQIKIEIIDRGPGIESRHLPRLFERFYRVDKARSREHGGTGLGLAIVKHIMQAHGGGVEVRSKVGEGSVFTLSLPDGISATEKK